MIPTPARPCSAQEAHIKPASLQAPPFKVRRTAPRPGLIRARITLHLHEAADEGRRMVELGYTVHLRAGQPVAECRGEERHEFITQVVHYDGSDGRNSGHPAAAHGAQTAAGGSAQAAGGGHAAAQPAGVDQNGSLAAGGTQKLKKQRLS